MPITSVNYYSLQGIYALLEDENKRPANPIVISIVDPEMKVGFNEAVLDHLHLNIADYSLSPDIYDLPVEKLSIKEMTVVTCYPKEMRVIFDEDHAREVKRFVDENHLRKESVSLLTHCLCGYSRSTAIASWVAGYLKIPFQEPKTRNDAIFTQISSLRV